MDKIAEMLVELKGLVAERSREAAQAVDTLADFFGDRSAIGESAKPPKSALLDTLPAAPALLDKPAVAPGGTPKGPGKGKSWKTCGKCSQTQVLGIKVTVCPECGAPGLKRSEA